MIYTVTFNPALDYYISADEISFDDINRTTAEEIRFGGKGLNVSAVLSELGVQNTALGFKAGFTGEKLEALLRESGINADLIALPQGETRINVKIRADRELDFNARGAEIAAEDFEKLLAKLDGLEEGDVLILAGNAPQTLGGDAYKKILRSLDGRGVLTFVDAAGELLLNSLSAQPFLIKPNETELGELFGVEIYGADDAVKYAKLLKERGAQNVLVSLGEKGAALLCKNGAVYEIGAVKGKLVSSTGCGDSMLAGFVAGLLQTGDYASAIRLGTACAAATAFSAGLGTAEEINKMLSIINENNN